MDAPVAEELGRDMASEELLQCFYGHTELDRACFRILGSSSERLTVDDVAEGVDYDRSTVYRSIQRLLATGVVEKEQVNHDEGGCYHVYSVVDPEEITRELRQILNGWHAETEQLIDEFERKYDETASPTVEN